MSHRRLVAVLTATAVVAVPASAAAAGPSADAAAKRKTLVGVAAGDSRFSTLVELVQAAGLAKTLSKGSFTVFAPTNKAFSKVPQETLDALAGDKAMLRSVLLYHAVEGRVPAKKVVKLKSAKTVNGASVAVSVRNGKVRLNKSARVTQTDIKARNGIIHVINRVLLPPGS